LGRSQAREQRRKVKEVENSCVIGGGGRKSEREFEDALKGTSLKAGIRRLFQGLWRRRGEGEMPMIGRGLWGRKRKKKTLAKHKCKDG